MISIQGRFLNMNLFFFLLLYFSHLNSAQNTLSVDISENAKNSFYEAMHQKIIPNIKNGGIVVIPVKSKEECELLKIEDFEVVKKDQLKNCQSKAEADCGFKDSINPEYKVN